MLFNLKADLRRPVLLADNTKVACLLQKHNVCTGHHGGELRAKYLPRAKRRGTRLRARDDNAFGSWLALVAADGERIEADFGVFEPGRGVIEVL